MKILALVPARGGSKRIPGKNIRPLGAKPLICWSLEVAQDIPEVADVLVSTDDASIAAVARAAGALIPWLRPAELASDSASSVDVSMHALEWYENEKGPVDGLLLLQPTSPFRSRRTVLRGIDLFRQHGCAPVIGVSPAKSHPTWCFQIKEERLRPFIPDADLHARSQDLVPAYVVNGALYLIAPQELRARRSFITDATVPLVVDDLRESIDIDYEWDWKLAEAILGMPGADSGEQAS